MELIDKSEVVAEIKRRIVLLENNSNGIISTLASGILVNDYKDLLSFLDTLEVKEVDLEKEEEKLNKAIKLADAMYDAAQRLTTDASRLHKAMQDWWHFKNFSL